MVYPEQNLKLNNLERASGVAVKYFEANAKYKVGDIILLGHCGLDANITRCYIDMNNGDEFPMGFQIAVGEGIDEGTFGQWASFQPLDHGIIHLPLPMGDNLDLTGAPYTGDSPIQRGDYMHMAIKILSTPPSNTQGRFKLILEYDYTGTKQSGGYYS